MSFTDTIETEKHIGLTVPKDPWTFGKNLESNQTVDLRTASDAVHLLFNKGRYFEMTIHNRKLLVSISKAIKSKIKYNCMIVDSWRKLEAIVKAFNKRGIYVSIEIDWI